MFKMNFRRIIVLLFVIGVFLFNLNAEVNIIPLIDFGMLQLENDNYLYSPTGNFQFKYQKENDTGVKGPDVIAGSLSYGQDIFSKLHADFGVYSTLGNHDYGDYYYGKEDSGAKRKNLKDLIEFIFNLK